MKKLILLSTGGTIASMQGEKGLAPAMHANDLLKNLPVLPDVTIECRDVFMLDSSNIQPEEWRVLAHKVYEVLDECDGVIITHGTDTMAYTAAALSFMLKNLQKPVVLTGSQLPLSHPMSDAPANLLEAMVTASSGHPGVMIVFHHKVIAGTRAVKMRTTAFNAFDSVNAYPLGYLDADGLHFRHEPKPPKDPCTLEDAMDASVFLLKLIPGTSPAVFDFIASAGYKGLVLEAFGLGGLHYIRRNLIDKLRMLSEKGIYTLVTTQCMYERADFSIYEVGHDILSQRVISAHDMTSEAAVTKLEWVLGDPERRLPLLRENICGEMH